MLVEHLLGRHRERLAQRLVAAAALVHRERVQPRLVDPVEQQLHLRPRSAPGTGDRRTRGSAAACPRAPGARPRGPRRSCSASSGSSGPTYSPSTDAIGAMSHAPRHSNARTWTFGVLGRGRDHRLVERRRRRAASSGCSCTRRRRGGPSARGRSRACRRRSRPSVRYAGVTCITAATWSIASGEHQPCSSCAAWSAGITAEWRSGYLAIAASICRAELVRDGRRRRVGDDRRVLVQVDRVVPARDARAVAEARDSRPSALTGRSLRGSGRASRASRSGRRCSRP